MEQAFYGIMAFVFGTVLGSFANACVYRLPLDLSIFSTRSMCTRCGNMVAAYDNIPLVSYLILRGKCRSCAVSISLGYPAIELFCGLMAFGMFRFYDLTFISIYFFFFSVALVIVSAIDFRHRIIPDVISIPGIWLGLAIAGLASWLGFTWVISFRDAILGMVVGGGLLWGVAKFYEVIMQREGVGFGNVKLLAMFGVHAGIPGVLASLLYGSMFGSAVGVFMILFRGKGRRYPIPFGPFLCLGLLVYAIWGQEAINWPVEFLQRLFT